MSTEDLEGRRALVTGAARGVGQQIAFALARAGADLTITDRLHRKLTQAADGVRATGRRCIAITADLSREEAAHKVVTCAVDELGGLDILVNNAGISQPVSIDRVSQGMWERILLINLESTVAICAEAGPHLRSQQHSSIVNVASAAAFVGMPSSSHYAASKAALVSFTQSLAAEWASDGVRVNALCPGWTRTPMTEPLRRSAAVSANLLSRVPLRRWAEPSEIASAAVFLVGPSARAITGTVLVVDGGAQTRQHPLVPPTA